MNLDVPFLRGSNLGNDRSLQMVVYNAEWRTNA